MVKLPTRKQTREAAITALRPPTRVRIAVDKLTPTLAQGEAVRAGQVVARGGPLDERRHSPFTGTLVSVDHQGIVIEGEPEEPERIPASEDVIETARLAGLVGLGGGMFPTWVKLKAALGRADTVLVNACESEPYVTCDHRVLEEQGELVERGLERILAATGAKQGWIARHSGGFLDGYESLLVERELGRNVPQGGRPLDVGALVLNVQTVWSLERALSEGRPLIERVVTVDGEALTEPGNLLVPLGTPVGHVLTQRGVDPERAARLVLGGPLMGQPATFATSVTAGTIALLALSPAEVAAPAKTACIRCRRCAETCPYDLPAPQLAARFGALTEVCVSCGLCELVCPASRPLVLGIRQQRVNHESRDAAKAEPQLGADQDRAALLQASRVWSKALRARSSGAWSLPPEDSAPAPQAEKTRESPEASAPAPRRREALATAALFLLAALLQWLSPLPSHERRDAESRLGGAVERVNLPGPPAFRRGEEVAVFFSFLGAQGSVRGVILLNEAQPKPGLLKAAQIREVVLFEAREGVQRNALQRAGIGATLRGRPAQAPLSLTAVSGATISTQRLADAINERLRAWQERGS